MGLIDFVKEAGEKLFGKGTAQAAMTEVKADPANEAKIKAVVEGFDGLTGSGFVPPGAPELASLAVPKQTVTVKPKGAAAVVLKIGDARGEDVVVQKVGQDALWLKKYQVERFLKKASDLAKDKK